jgi:hypothetical protein
VASPFLYKEIGHIFAAVLGPVDPTAENRERALKEREGCPRLLLVFGVVALLHNCLNAPFIPSLQFLRQLGINQFRIELDGAPELVPRE